MSQLVTLAVSKDDGYGNFKNMSVVKDAFQLFQGFIPDSLKILGSALFPSKSRNNTWNNSKLIRGLSS